MRYKFQGPGRQLSKWRKFIFSWVWSGTAYRFSSLRLYFILTIYYTIPEEMDATKIFLHSERKAQSGPGRAFLGIFRQFRPKIVIFSRFLTQKSIWKHELVVFYRYLDILIHFTQVVDVSTLQRANFRPKIGLITWFLLVYAEFDVNQQHLLRLRSWIHQNVSEFHGESDGKALHAYGRSENAKICKITWFSLVYADFDVKMVIDAR